MKILYRKILKKKEKNNSKIKPLFATYIQLKSNKVNRSSLTESFRTHRSQTIDSTFQQRVIDAISISGLCVTEPRRSYEKRVQQRRGDRLEIEAAEVVGSLGNRAPEIGFAETRSRTADDPLPPLC